MIFLWWHQLVIFLRTLAYQIDQKMGRTLLQKDGAWEKKILEECVNDHVCKWSEMKIKIFSLFKRGGLLIFVLKNSIPEGLSFPINAPVTRYKIISPFLRREEVWTIYRACGQFRVSSYRISKMSAINFSVQNGSLYQVWCLYHHFYGYID